ncbi:class I tRNA ligase family protein [Candidatus Nomurabacteria bacterium]|nr:class I tRNA ligase family protein [Candidatus Nomurabacteria bacterium]
MKEYDHKKIEKKWQNEWDKNKIYTAKTGKAGKKFYGLIEFPYPSGAGLHVGHIRSNTAMDIISRKRRMEGYNVLYPIGWDAFGLPTENYAIKTGIQPAKVTKQNTDTFRKQLKMLGFSFDWSREVNTTDPAYYKWTQWIFLQMYKKGLAYKAKTEINWCPKDKIGLANEEAEGGVCDRCGGPVEKREKEQWMLAITKYADRLDKDLDTVDYLEKIKIQQRNWIGKSEGALVKFDDIEIFTTRPDTMYGATFIAIAGKADRFTGQYVTNPASKEKIPVWEAEYVLGDYGTGAIMGVPAHDERDFEFAKKNKIKISQVIMPVLRDLKNLPRNDKKDTKRDVVHVILRNLKNKEILLAFLKDESWGDNKPINFIIGGIEEGETEVEASIREIKEETGYTDVEFKEKLSIETCAEFFQAQKDVNRIVHVRTLVFNLLSEKKVEINEEEKQKHDFKWIPESQVASKITIPDDTLAWKYYQVGGFAYEGEGTLINSGEFTGMDSEVARKKITEYVGGKIVTKFKLRDWVFSRQRYWGEPIPIVNCDKCGYVPLNEKDLPLELPKVKSYEPTDNGESPLANITAWVNTKCPKCKGKAKRETDTMPNWAGSSWYFLRYTDPKNKKEFASMKALKYWMKNGVDWYNGGMEHTTLHLLYSRFWHKFLYDLKVVPTKEPYMKRTSHGMILAESGAKMSKSVGNTVNPDEIVKLYGADTLRMYEMFMGPFDQAVSWSTESMIGPRRFLERVWRLGLKVASPTQQNFRALPSLRGLRHAENSPMSAQLLTILHKTIKKVTEDIESMNFNTAVSSMMMLLNDMEKCESVQIKDYKIFLQILAPFAPHIAEELWLQMGERKSIHLSKWPKYDPKKLENETVKIGVQVNGKVRAELVIGKDEDEDEIKAKAMRDENVIKWMDGKSAKKIIYVKGRLVNIVI